METPIKSLSDETRNTLLEDLFYLNTKELYSFCDRHNIPYWILIETENGGTKKSRDKDRKRIVIARVIHFLKTGEIPAATVFPEKIVRLSGLPERFDKRERLYYGCYNKKNPEMISFLQELTEGKFRNGAIARILLRDFWSRGAAPTFEEFAIAWLRAKENYSLDQHPEAAYLTDRAKGKTDSNWKKKRNIKAQDVLSILSKVGGSQN